MHATREVAVRLVEEGAIHITQKGQAVDPHTFKGPIRLRLVPETKTLGVSKVTAELPSFTFFRARDVRQKKSRDKGKGFQGDVETVRARRGAGAEKETKKFGKGKLKSKILCQKYAPTAT